MDDASESGFARFRRFVLGPRARDADTASSSIAGAGRANIGFLAPERGPFDDPPPEPIELDADALPWELRDEE